MNRLLGVVLGIAMPAKVSATSEEGVSGTLKSCGTFSIRTLW